MMKVSKNMVVYFRYSMENQNGEVIEDTMDAASTYYLHGASGIASFLQSQFEGLGVGDFKNIFLNDESENVSFKIIIDKLRPASEEELKLGYPLDENVTCGPQCNCNNTEG